LLSVEGEEGWEEIVDDRISKEVNKEELKVIATLAKQCVSPSSKNRPQMREVSQQLLRLGKKRSTSHSSRATSTLAIPEHIEES
jgi:hypothetical protein